MEDAPRSEDRALQEQWQRSLSNLAGESIAIEPFWNRLFGDWRRFEIPSTHVTLAKQASEAWAKLADAVTTDLEPDVVTQPVEQSLGADASKVAADKIAAPEPTEHERKMAEADNEEVADSLAAGGPMAQESAAARAPGTEPTAPPAQKARGKNKWKGRSLTDAERARYAAERGYAVAA
jgi:hypothetical protein